MDKPYDLSEIRKKSINKIEYPKPNEKPLVEVALINAGRRDNNLISCVHSNNPEVVTAALKRAFAGRKLDDLKLIANFINIDSPNDDGLDNRVSCLIAAGGLDAADALAKRYLSNGGESETAIGFINRFLSIIEAASYSENQKVAVLAITDLAGVEKKPKCPNCSREGVQHLGWESQPVPDNAISDFGVAYCKVCGYIHGVYSFT